MGGEKEMQQNLEAGDAGAADVGQEVASVSPSELPPEARDVIGRQLRKAYTAKLNEPVPDKFAKLLEALAKGEGS